MTLLLEYLFWVFLLLMPFLDTQLGIALEGHFVINY